MRAFAKTVTGGERQSPPSLRAGTETAAPAATHAPAALAWSAALLVPRHPAEAVSQAHIQQPPVVAAHAGLVEDVVVGDGGDPGAVEDVVDVDDGRQGWGELAAQGEVGGPVGLAVALAGQLAAVAAHGQLHRVEIGDGPVQARLA